MYVPDVHEVLSGSAEPFLDGFKVSSILSILIEVAAILCHEVWMSMQEFLIPMLS